MSNLNPSQFGVPVPEGTRIRISGGMGHMAGDSSRSITKMVPISTLKRYTEYDRLGRHNTGDSQARVRAIADEVGAKVLFDAAHLCGMIAGKVWPQPLEEGAHLMTFSTYKSLGGPAGGLIVTNDDEIAQTIDAIAYPGLTANFDAAKTAALGITLQDWKSVGRDYAQMMVQTSKALAENLQNKSVAIFAADKGFTTSHQFAILAAPYGGGQTAAKRMGQAGLLACGIGLPVAPVDGDLNGLRIGTPEIVRLGMKVEHMQTLAEFIAKSLNPSSNPDEIRNEVTEWRKQFSGVHYTVDMPS